MEKIFDTLYNDYAFDLQYCEIIALQEYFDNQFEYLGIYDDNVCDYITLVNIDKYNLTKEQIYEQWFIQNNIPVINKIDFSSYYILRLVDTPEDTIEYIINDINGIQIYL